MKTTLSPKDEITRKPEDIACRTAKPYRVKPVSMGQAAESRKLDKALQLADEIEDEEIARKLQPRK